jgi:hypothetical protein
VAAVLADRTRQQQSQKRRPLPQRQADDPAPADDPPPEESGDEADGREVRPALVRRPEPPPVERTDASAATNNTQRPVAVAAPPGKPDLPEKGVPPMQDRKRRSWFLPLLAFASLVVAGFSLAPRFGQLWQKTESAGVAASGKRSVFLTRPIEQVRPGDRVLAHNPEITEEERAAAAQGEGRNTAIHDPRDWRLLRMVLIAADGHRVDVELLRPKQWVEEQGAAVGEKVWLDLEELGAEGEAQVVAVSDCPRIAAGSGRVVTGTFRHESGALVDVLVDGHAPLGCTANHPFWSEDRQAFVRADQLRQGERLRAADGRTARVSSVVRRAGSHPVYNLEVETEHVYHVGSAGALVHNACTKGTPVTPKVTRDKSGRITSSTATITNANLNGGTGTTAASRRGLPSGYDAGHIIGRQLGGQGGATANNIFPQLSSINRGQYRLHETWVAGQVRAGNNVQVRIELIYPNSTTTRPSQIIYHTTINGTPTTPVTFTN